MNDVEQRLSFLRGLEPEDLLEELLATIHGDGGHYSDEYGLAKAVADAEKKWYTLNAGSGGVAPTTPKTPEGWQMVPKEPTEEMCQAALDCQEHDPEDEPIAEMYHLYSAMLSAAPAAPSAEGVSEVGVLGCSLCYDGGCADEKGCGETDSIAARTAPTAPAGGEAPVAMVVIQKDRIADFYFHLAGCDLQAGEHDLYTHPSADLRGAAEQALEAARYRWLRNVAHPDTNSGLRCVGNCADGGEPLHIGGRDLDRAVDAAIASLEAAISRKGKTE